MIIWAFYALASAIFFAIRDILAKKFLKQNVSENQMVFEEFLIMMLVIIMLFFPNVDFSSYNELATIYIFKAVFIAGSTILYLRLLKSHEISTVSPLINLSPLILLILSSLFLSEAISTLQFVGIIIIIVSTYFLEVNFHEHHHKKDKSISHFQDLKVKDSKFVFGAILMLLFFSGAAIMDKVILESVNVYTNMYFTSIIIFVIYLTYYWKEKQLALTLKHMTQKPETSIVAIFTIVSNFLFLLAIAVPGALVSLVVPLRRTSTLFSSLFGGILFHDHHLKRKMLATVFMIIGVALILSTGTLHIE